MRVGVVDGFATVYNLKGNKMTNEEIKKILEKHKNWLNDKDGGICANLSGANLKGANLIGANLRGANLEDANIRCANLEDANLIGANLEDSNLECANLKGANLIGANLIGANLEYANLEYANLSGANLIGANLEYANLSGANLRGATGNNKQVKSLQLGKYYIAILVDIRIHIGCQNNTIEQWENFTDEEIARMDNGALEWWKEWKEFILKVAKANNV